MFHRQCYQEMFARTSNCAGCHHEMEPENPRALEMPEDNVSLEVLVDDFKKPIRFAINTEGMFTLSRFQALVLEDIAYYRREGLPNPHRPGTPFWNILPYFIPEHCFFTYLSGIETFTQMYVDSTMYLHGFVSLPTPVTVVACQSMYEIFLANIPKTVFRLVEGIRFRFLFHYSPFQDSIRITQMTVLPFGERTWYMSDLPHYL